MTCATKPQSREMGRLSVDSSGERLTIQYNGVYYVTDSGDAVLAGAIRCGQTVVHLTDEEADWVYRHI